MREFDYFKTDECNNKFNIWINNFPESFHPADLDRFTNLVISLLDNNEILEYDHLTQSTIKLEEKHIEAYIDKFHSMKDIYEKLKIRWA